MASNATQRREKRDVAERDDDSRELTHRPTEDMLTYLRDYARENPEYAALWCFGIGFVVGWKLKPW